MIYLIITAQQNGGILNEKGYYALQKENFMTWFVSSAVQNKAWMLLLIITAQQNGAILNEKGYYALQKEDFMTWFVSSAVQNKVLFM